MQSILAVGALDAQQAQAILTTVRHLSMAQLTVYAPATTRSNWPSTTHFIAGELTDVASLSQAMAGQPLVLAQLTPQQLVPQTRALITAMHARGIKQIVLTSPQSVLSLVQQPIKWYQTHQQRQQLRALHLVEQLLQQSQLDFTLVEGTQAMDTAIYTQQMSASWATAMPTRRSLPLKDYLTTGATWSLTA
ncbi:NAD(P)H-binding protein [Lactobacillus sp. CBA3606]|uniref:NAD(P)H-binding protein n=1 Tax=Lactobacillus sp. CBA3606 TaxID=2099789 RepID=UPI001319FE82|nr:NAD(P)H-binding protein [Lactobacillus sp. CBA3606]